jgi:hypothetical protein
VAFPGVTDYWTRCKVSSIAITIKKNTKRKEIYGSSTKKGNLWDPAQKERKFACFVFLEK